MFGIPGDGTDWQGWVGLGFWKFSPKGLDLETGGWVGSLIAESTLVSRPGVSR